MVDFVLESNNKIAKSYNREKCGDLIFKYANFLKQPLELWMFVPCDENGNVLEEPKNYKEWDIKKLNVLYDLDLSKYEEYQQAKKRCLFEGFEYKRTNYDLATLHHLSLKENREWVENKNYCIVYLKDFESKTIEDLVKYNLQLTPTALK